MKGAECRRYPEGAAAPSRLQPWKISAQCAIAEPAMAGRSPRRRRQVHAMQTVAPLGIEPRFAAPKAAVLPLDEGAGGEKASRQSHCGKAARRSVTVAVAEMRRGQPASARTVGDRPRPSGTNAVPCPCACDGGAMHGDAASAHPCCMCTKPPSRMCRRENMAMTPHARALTLVLRRVDSISMMCMDDLVRR